MSNVEPIRDLKQLQKLLKYLKKDYYMYYVIFTFGLYTGLRVSDILALNVDDVVDKTTLKIRSDKQGEITCPITPALSKIIKKYLKWRDKSIKWGNASEYEPLFLSIQHNRMDRSQVYRVFRDVAAKVGIDQRIGTNTMRKTFGYWHYKQFKDVAMLQKIFNHVNPADTLRFIGIAQDSIDESYKTLNYKEPSETCEFYDSNDKSCWEPMPDSKPLCPSKGDFHQCQYTGEVHHCKQVMKYMSVLEEPDKSRENVLVRPFIPVHTRSLKICEEVGIRYVDFTKPANFTRLFNLKVMKDTGEDYLSASVLKDCCRGVDEYLDRLSNVLVSTRLCSDTTKFHDSIVATFQSTLWE